MNIFKLKFREFVVYSLFYSLLIIISIIPLASFRLGELSSIFPAIEIVIIFYFSIYKPSILPLWLLFTYGIILDLVYGLAVGISVIPVIIISFLLRNQRQIFNRKEFKIVFLGFSLACILYLGLKYIIFSWYYSHFFDLKLVLIQGISTIFIYPIIHYSLQQIEKIIK
ncbi:MAG: rod shape-determining protein MreD [Rickettsiaceae bacterium]|jgi:rod shape-determining protein MreD|nr:rod shape-determining protein MreD [Rickettsiaceae bacterium]